METSKTPYESIRPVKDISLDKPEFYKSWYTKLVSYGNKEYLGLIIYLAVEENEIL